MAAPPGAENHRVKTLGRPDRRTLSPETAAAIEQGLDDIRNARTISLTDCRRTRGL